MGRHHLAGAGLYRGSSSVTDGKHENCATPLKGFELMPVFGMGCFHPQFSKMFWCSLSWSCTCELENLSGLLNWGLGPGKWGTLLRALCGWFVLFAVENENHCDFVKLREMLIRVNMEDLREQTHTRHYELYRRCKLEEMGFKDTDPDSKPFR